MAETSRKFRREIPRTGKAMVGEEVVWEEPAPGAGVGAGGNRVRFQEIPEDTCGAGKVGLEVSGAASEGARQDTEGNDSGGG